MEDILIYHPCHVLFHILLFLGNVACSAYPIEQLDSINSKTGELNEVSALNLIVFGVRYTFITAFCIRMWGVWYENIDYINLIV